MGRSRTGLGSSRQSMIDLPAVALQEPVTFTRPDAGGSDFEALLHFTMEIETFASNWVYCDQLSTFLARTVSHNRTDSVRFASLFSMILNELLEVVFRARHSGGNLECRILRSGNWDRIDLSYPCSEDERAFIMKVLAETDGDVLGRYLSSLSSGMTSNREVALLELMINYRALVGTGDVSKDMVRLIVDVPLEELFT